MKQLRVPKMPRSAELEMYLRDNSTVVANEFSKRTPDDTVRKSILLRSTDDESIWEVTVNNAGTLSTTKVSE